MKDGLPPMVVDEEGKLMNYLNLFPRSNGRGDKGKMIRPFIYYCHDCKISVMMPERIRAMCMFCGSPLFVRECIKGNLVWKR